MYDLQVNDDSEAAERMSERQKQHFNVASERRTELKEKLGVEQSTDLTEIGADC